MRTRIASLAGLLVALSIVAAMLQPPQPPSGVCPLLWASSSNPFRVAQVEHFNATHSGLHLTLDSSNNRFEKIVVQISSGVGPDLFYALTGSYVQAYVETGAAWDLSPAAAANGIAADADAWPAIHNEITYEGRQYGYPANCGTYLILYNKNIFDRCKVPYPSGSPTWEEFFTLLQRVSRTPSRDGERIWGTNAMDNSGRAPASILWKQVFYSRHAEFFSADGTRPLIDTDDLRAAFQLHREALFRYGVMPTAVELGTMTGQGGWGGGASTQFAEGRFATVVGTKAFIATLGGFVDQQKRQLARWLADPERQRRELRPEVLRIGAAPLPHFAGRPLSCVAISQTIIINPGSPRREQALAFLRFLASADYARMVEIYGLPGNPRNVRFDYPITYPELAEHEITRCVVDLMLHGYQTRKSSFLLDFDVERVLTDQIARLEADPALEPAFLLAEAQEELDGLLRLNLDRDPRLAKLFRERAPGGRPAINSLR